MIILYITNGINGSGGLERVLAVKASYLAEHYNYKVHILCLNGTDQNPFYEFSSQIKFHSINVGGNPLQYFLSYKKGIHKVVNEIQPQIISVCDDGLKAFFLPKLVKTKARWIYERHVSKLIEKRDTDSFIKQSITSFKWNLMEHLANNYSRFIVLTDGNKKEWPSLNNMIVIPNPLSFYPDESSTLEKKIVICVGKISYQKGQDLLLEIWNKINFNFPDWELHWYGKENIEYLNTNDLPSSIKFFHPEKDIQSKYLDSAIYVMTSRFEGFGMVLIEAMACGVPCVSFDCDYGPGDIIKDNEDGYLVPNGNLQVFEEKLMDLMLNEEKRKQFGAKAKENVKRYSVEEVVKQWDGLFRDLISRR